MHSINFLTWREQLRAKKRARFFLEMGLCLLFVAILAVFLFLHEKKGVALQMRRIAILNKHNAKLLVLEKQYNNIEKQRNEIIAKFKLIDTLRLSGENINKLIRELQKNIDNNCKLDKISYFDDALTIELKVFEHAKIAGVNKSLSRLNFLAKPKVNVNVGANNHRSFTNVMIQTRIKQNDFKQ